MCCVLCDSGASARFIQQQFARLVFQQLGRQFRQQPWFFLQFRKLPPQVFFRNEQIESLKPIERYRQDGSA